MPPIRYSFNGVKNVIKNRCNNKANLFGGIPAKIFKLSLESFTQIR